MSRRFATAVNGVLWIQDATTVWDYSDDPSNGSSEVFSMRVRTAPIMVGAAPLARGRCRGASVNGTNLGAHRLAVRIYGDNTNRVMADKFVDQVADTTPTNWPGDATPDIRTTTQRCHTASVELIATPASAEWTSIDVWVDGSDDRQLSSRRA